MRGADGRAGQRPRQPGAKTMAAGVRGRRGRAARRRQRGPRRRPHDSARPASERLAGRGPGQERTDGGRRRGGASRAGRVRRALLRRRLAGHCGAGGQRRSGRPLPASPLPAPQWPASRRRRSARLTRPALLAPRRRPPSVRSWPGPRPASRSEAGRAESWGRRRGPRCRRLAARPRRPRTPAAIVFAPGWRGRAVLPGRPRRALELGGARQPGPAEAREAGRRRRGGHDRGAERAAAERGAEAPADIFESAERNYWDQRCPDTTASLEDSNGNLELAVAFLTAKNAKTPQQEETTYYQTVLPGSDRYISVGSQADARP
uniref:Uncharacterized protein n=1 Tax=Equus asinus TaxID=9793 RepID=A0A9L0JHL0_EQUAS